MNAIGLGIGNLVLFNNTYRVIESIGKYECEHCSIDKVFSMKSTYQDIKPIPLTEDNIKPEFSRSSDGYGYFNYSSKCGDITIYMMRTGINKGKWFMNGATCDFEIKSFHHLQNIFFDLKGEELKMEDK